VTAHLHVSVAMTTLITGCGAFPEPRPTSAEPTWKVDAAGVPEEKMPWQPIGGPDGSRIAIGSVDGLVRLFDVETGAASTTT
jgi:hypothetical protein